MPELFCINGPVPKYLKELFAPLDDLGEVVIVLSLALKEAYDINVCSFDNIAATISITEEFIRFSIDPAETIKKRFEILFDKFRIDNHLVTRCSDFSGDGR